MHAGASERASERVGWLALAPMHAIFPTHEPPTHRLHHQVWLGRVDISTAEQGHAALLNRSAWEFYCGLYTDGSRCWTREDNIAVAVFEFPLHTAVQQVNWVEQLKRYLLPNWAWLSMDGNPKPQLGLGAHAGGPGHMRSQLTLFEAEQPWGPWRIFHRDDNWRSPAETSDRFPGQVFRGGGAYTPVFPPAWIKQGPNASAVELWMVWTQCCPGTRHGYNITPVAHYAFAAQRLCVVGASSSTGVGGAAGKV